MNKNLHMLASFRDVDAPLIDADTTRWTVKPDFEGRKSSKARLYCGITYKGERHGTVLTSNLAREAGLMMAIADAYEVILHSRSAEVRLPLLFALDDADAIELALLVCGRERIEVRCGTRLVFTLPGRAAPELSRSIVSDRLHE